MCFRYAGRSTGNLHSADLVYTVFLAQVNGALEIQLIKDYSRLAMIGVKISSILLATESSDTMKLQGKVSGW